MLADRSLRGYWRKLLQVWRYGPWPGYGCEQDHWLTLLASVLPTVPGREG
ncbi:hypothetical protein [Thermogemmatispora carboxidivorans]|nr:hypothetical protein [Thermogemmatispora carboxidivorans]